MLRPWHNHAVAVTLHSTACVDPDARIGDGTRIGPFAVVESQVEVGSCCRIESHAVLKRFTSLGEGNQVFEGAVLGGIPQDLKFRETASRLVVGNGNIFRENVTVHRATGEGGVTRIGDSNYLMAGSHVAHNCRIEDRVILANNVALAGHVHIETGAFLSGGVVVHQFVQVGRYAMVGGNSKIERDVPPFFLVDGVPGRIRGLNMVGLRRAGFSRDSIFHLRSAYRILALPGVRLEEKLQRLTQLQGSEIDHLIRFVQRSQRGLTRFHRG